METGWDGKTGRPRPRTAREVFAKMRELALRNRRVIIVAACALVFVLFLEDALKRELARTDLAAYLVVVQSMRAEWLTPVMEAFSALATPVSLIVMLLMITAFAPGRRPGACCALNLALVVALNQALKFLIQRPRPEGFALAAETGFSFPSGHSMAAMAFFGLLAWMVWHYQRDNAVRWGCAVAFSLVIVMIGLSRIYLGVHYASDVLGGFCVSLAWLALYTRLVAPLFLGEVPKRGEASTPPTPPAPPAPKQDGGRPA